jgi:hypothetical protein
MEFRHYFNIVAIYIVLSNIISLIFRVSNIHIQISVDSDIYFIVSISIVILSTFIFLIYLKLIYSLNKADIQMG